MLVPLGRFNLNHDDNRWDLPRRSLVDRGVPVLPVDRGVGRARRRLPRRRRRRPHDELLNYQAYVVNGVALDFEFEQIAQTRFAGARRSR